MARRASTSVVRTFDVGVDIGSANTVIASAGRGVLFDEPTCVAFASRADEAVAYGFDAASAIGKSGDRLLVVRPISRAKPIDIDALHSFLTHVVKTLKGGEIRCDSASVALGTVLTSREQSAIRHVWKELGVTDIYFVPDVVAASRGERRRGDLETITAVLDIGAEMTTWGLVENGVLKQSVTWEIGVSDLTTDLVSFLQRRYGLRVAESQAAAVISAIGLRGRSEADLSLRIAGKRDTSGSPTTQVITALDVFDAVIGQIDDLAMRIKRSIERLPESTLRNLMDSGVHFVGGGALMPGLGDDLHERVGLPIRIAEDPLRATALGAAETLVCCG